MVATQYGPYLLGPAKHGLARVSISASITCDLHGPDWLARPAKYGPAQLRPFRQLWAFARGRSLDDAAPDDAARPQYDALAHVGVSVGARCTCHEHASRQAQGGDAHRVWRATVAHVQIDFTTVRAPLIVSLVTPDGLIDWSL